MVQFVGTRAVSLENLNFKTIIKSFVPVILRTALNRQSYGKSLMGLLQLEHMNRMIALQEFLLLRLLTKYILVVCNHAIIAMIPSKTRHMFSIQPKIQQIIFVLVFCVFFLRVHEHMNQLRSIVSSSICSRERQRTEICVG